MEGLVRYFLAVLLLLGLALPSTGQQRYLKQFGAADGLPQPFIYALLQDRTGYLWIGTGEGLVRYDGTEFVTFTTKDGLAEDFVTVLREEPQTGQLWVGHYQGGVSHWTGQRFTTVPSRGAATANFLQPTRGVPAITNPAIAAYLRRYQPELPAGTTVSCLLHDREGNSWLGTAGQGLWRHTDLHLAFYPNSLPLAKGITALGGDKSAVAGTNLGTLRPLPTASYLTSTPGHVESVPAPITAFIEQPTAAGKPSVYWVGTAEKGVWRVQAGQKAQLVSSFPTDLQVSALALTADGSLWVGTSTDGLYWLPSHNPQTAQHFTTANGLLHNSVKALLADKEGQLWIATHGTGLTVWNERGFKYYRLVPGGLDATALAADKAGRIWICTEGDGLFCYDKGRFQHYTMANGLPSDYCYALVPLPGQAKTEQLLITHRNSLTVFDPIKGSFWPVASPNNPWVHDCLPLATSNQNHVWLGTRTGLLRLALDHSFWSTEPHLASVALRLAEVDGATRNPNRLGKLAAGKHRVTFLFRGVSLLRGSTLQYQYRLRGLADTWSRPSSVGEAQFPGLDAGNYTFEVRARSGETGAWSKPTVVTFAIATPFWRTAWFGAAVLATLLLGGYGILRAREATLRKQKLRLEKTVRKRTTRLRRQNAHIEQINQELIVARDAAEASRKAKAQFLANMSHEIRTPMNAVIGLTHLLRNTAPTTEQTEYLTAIQSSSQNLLVIINDILDSSKIEAGKLTLEHTPFNLPELLERVGRMFEFATINKGLAFRVHVAPTVPAAVFGDSVRLNQVLVNLVGNAIKFTTHGAVTLAATVVDATTTEAAVVHFAITDTGIGIAADKLETIFEDFSQANTSTTRQFGGTGLGLSIARNIVQLHGGRLWVESTEGIGSTFHVEIPYAIADEAQVRPEGVADLRPFAPALRVLVAEDNELNQLVARKTLEAWNVEVTLADNGRLAVQAALLASFDLVLMDVQMPEMDGYEASRQLRLHFPDQQQLPIIGLTASALPEDRALALAAGMNDTLAKPFDPALLYARIAYYTGRNKQDDERQVTINVASCEVAAPALPSLDWTLLEELAGGNAAFLAQLINTVLQQAPLLLNELSAAAASTDLHTLARAAHKLKGQVAYFGASTMQQQLATLERQARQPQPETDFSAAVAALTAQWASILPQLEARLQEQVWHHNSE